MSLLPVNHPGYCFLTRFEKTVGLVSPTDVPFTSLPLGKATFQITTSVGRSLQTYDLKKGLNLVFLTRPQTPGQITATCANGDHLLSAWASEEKGSPGGIWIFKRGKKVGEVGLPSGNTERIQQLLIFGIWLIAYCETLVEVWRIPDFEHYTTIHPRKGGLGAQLSGGCCHLPTSHSQVHYAISPLLSELSKGWYTRSTAAWFLRLEELVVS